MMNDFMDEIGKMFEGRSRGSSGMFSLEIEADATREMLPPRPIHGPEAPDMKIIEFQCCGERAKIRNRWYAVSNCPFCESKIHLS